MSIWLKDKRELKNSPSAKEGIDADTENRYRREGARLIMDCGTALKLKYETLASAVVFYHRFFMCHSFKEFSRHVVAVASLFLGGKVEETPKKCKDLIPVAKKLITDHHFTSFGEDPKETLLATERVLLKTIRFDLALEHPYAYLLTYAKILKGDKNKIQSLVQMAWTFVNDSLCTNLCLQWEPEIIAIALMYLASRLSRFQITDWEGKGRTHGKQKEHWWDCFVEDLQEELLEEICHTVLDLYSTSQSKGAAKGAGRAKGPMPSAVPSASTGSAGSSSTTPSAMRTESGTRYVPAPGQTGPPGSKQSTSNVQQNVVSSSTPVKKEGSDREPFSGPSTANPDARPLAGGPTPSHSMTPKARHQPYPAKNDPDVSTPPFTSGQLPGRVLRSSSTYRRDAQPPHGNLSGTPSSLKPPAPNPQLPVNYFPPSGTVPPRPSTHGSTGAPPPFAAGYVSRSSDPNFGDPQRTADVQNQQTPVPAPQSSGRSRGHPYQPQTSPWPSGPHPGRSTGGPPPVPRFTDLPYGPPPRRPPPANQASYSPAFTTQNRHAFQPPPSRGAGGAY